MSLVEPGTKVGNTTSVVDEMNCGCMANTGTIKNIVTTAVMDITKPESGTKEWHVEGEICNNLKAV